MFHRLSALWSHKSSQKRPHSAKVTVGQILCNFPPNPILYDEGHGPSHRLGRTGRFEGCLFYKKFSRVSNRIFHINFELDLFEFISGGVLHLDSIYRLVHRFYPFDEFSIKGKDPSPRRNQALQLVRSRD